MSDTRNPDGCCDCDGPHMFCCPKTRQRYLDAINRATALENKNAELVSRIEAEQKERMAMYGRAVRAEMVVVEEAVKHFDPNFSAALNNVVALLKEFERDNNDLRESITTIQKDSTRYVTEVRALRKVAEIATALVQAPPGLDDLEFVRMGTELNKLGYLK